MTKLARAVRAETAEIAPFFEKCYRYEDPTRSVKTGFYSFFRVIESAQDPEVTHRGPPHGHARVEQLPRPDEHPRVKEARDRGDPEIRIRVRRKPVSQRHARPARRLEERLADFMRKEAAVTFSTGFQVNLGAIACLVGKGDTDLSRQAGPRLHHRRSAPVLRRRTKKFTHNDPADLRRLMRNDHESGRLIVVDGVFSMEGDIATLPEIVAVAREFGAGIMVDDAHGIGVLGRTRPRHGRALRARARRRPHHGHLLEVARVDRRLHLRATPTRSSTSSSTARAR